MAFDANGNLTVSDQQKAGTFSIEIPKEGEKFDESKIRKLNVASSLYGMLYAFDHLYMMGNRQLTRAKVLPDGTLGPTEFLAEMAGGGEHAGDDVVGHHPDPAGKRLGHFHRSRLGHIEDAEHLTARQEEIVTILHG